MAHYLVSARLRPDRLDRLREALAADEYASLDPFGRELTRSLKRARRTPEGRAVWEEEDHCSPPLTREREAVLDEHFEELRVTEVEPGEGWATVRELPALFPEFVRGGGGSGGADEDG